MPDKHGIMAARYAEKSEVWRLPGWADFGDLDRQPELDLGQHRIEPVIAGAVAKVGRSRLQPLQGRGAKCAAEDFDLEFVEGVKGGPAALDRAAAPLRRVILTLQGDQRVDAANGAERSDRLRRFRSVALVNRKTAGRGADAFATWTAAFDPVMRMT